MKKHKPPKCYIIDTNVLIHDPLSLSRFQDNHIIIPIVVLEELDDLKRGTNEIAKNARDAIRHLDRLREKGSLSEGITINGGGSLKVELDPANSSALLPPEFPKNKPDNRILAISKYLVNKIQDMPVILVSKDANLRVKGDALGIRSEDYKSDKVVEKPVAIKEVTVTEWFSDRICKTSPKLRLNEYAVIKGDEKERVVKGSGIEGKSQLLLFNSPWGLKPQNPEQTAAIDALLDNKIQLVALIGIAGTGKTLMGLAAGLEMVEKRIYKKMVWTRSLIPVGRDLGYLPGNIQEKMFPWTASVVDNLRVLLEQEQLVKDRRNLPPSHQYIIDSGMLSIEPYIYIRGRSLPNTYIVIDEAQNLTPHEVKTIITRAGINSKIVLMGDPDQIDNPYLDAFSNGLVYVAEKFKDEHIFTSITLPKGVRSELADIAARIL